GPDTLTVVEREDAVEIADEVAEIGEERAQVHFGADRGENECGGEQDHAEQETETFARDRLTIGGIEHSQLLLGENRNRDGHRIKVSGRSKEKQPGPSTRLQWHRPETQDAFFLRSASTNLISSIVPSQSLVVAGWKPFFWPSWRRSKAALSLTGASKNALAMAALASSGRPES